MRPGATPPNQAVRAMAVRKSAPRTSKPLSKNSATVSATPTDPTASP